MILSDKRKRFNEELSKKIKIVDVKMTENRDWINYFLMLKRWYYRLRDSNFYIKDNYSIGCLKMEDDYIWTFFILCYHFRDWLIINNIAPGKEIDNYINKNKFLSICADICNSNKHFFLDHNRSVRSGNKDTMLINIKAEIEYKNKKNYVSIPFIIGHENVEVINLAEECMQAWGKFILSKKLEIPEFKEENEIKNFVKWQIEL